MAFTTGNLAAIRGDGIRLAFAEMVASFEEARARRAVYNNLYRELAGMSDRDLDDIGVSRILIADIAYEEAYGKK